MHLGRAAVTVKDNIGCLYLFKVGIDKPYGSEDNHNLKKTHGLIGQVWANPKEV